LVLRTLDVKTKARLQAWVLRFEQGNFGEFKWPWGKRFRAYGVKEFAELVQMPSSNLSWALNSESNLTQQTLERLLQPFGLRVTLAPIIEPMQPDVA
jgi:hypothetical protein